MGMKLAWSLFFVALPQHLVTLPGFNSFGFATALRLIVVVVVLWWVPETTLKRT